MSNHRNRNSSRKNAKRGMLVMFECIAIKKGKECTFATRSGCFFADGHCDPIIQLCEGCSRIEIWPDGKYCSSCPAPESKWTRNICNMASHIEKEEEKAKKHVDPLKASKRKMMGQ
jgi:hypothetical protein